MKYALIILNLLAINVVGQSWEDCNVLHVTLDDLNTEYILSGQTSGCGCNTNSGTAENCYLINFKLVKTINGVETPKHISRLTFTSPITSANAEPNHIWKDYVDIFNPSTCREYQSNPGLNHQYNFHAPAPPGENLLIQVCPGSESGPMIGRFIADESAPDIPKATNVQATDGDNRIDITFNSTPGTYYMAFRSSDICNTFWEQVDFNSHWTMATTTQMSIRHQLGGQVNTQYKYRVMAADRPFVISSGASGEWSEPDFGHFLDLIHQFDESESCPNVLPPCPASSNVVLAEPYVSGYYSSSDEIRITGDVPAGVNLFLDSPTIIFDPDSSIDPNALISTEEEGCMQ